MDYRIVSFQIDSGNEEVAVVKASWMPTLTSCYWPLHCQPKLSQEQPDGNWVLHSDVRVLREFGT